VLETETEKQMKCLAFIINIASSDKLRYLFKVSLSYVEVP
jgi:hypothetical protein